MANIQYHEKDVYCIVTIDGDLRVGNKFQQKAGVEFIRRVHKDLGLLGQTTWFINERDFNWTEYHPEFLIDFMKTLECIGIHDHHDSYFADTYEAIYTLMYNARSRLINFYRMMGLDFTPVAHRNGCAIQSRLLYQTVIDLGYHIVSEVRPETDWFARMIFRNGSWVCLSESDPNSIYTNNLHIPLAATPWYHDADNWMEYKNQSGSLLHIPITSMPWINKDRVQKKYNESKQQVFLVFDTHPYDLQNPDSGDVSDIRTNQYRESLIWIAETFLPEFIRIDQVPDLLKTYN